VAFAAFGEFGGQEASDESGGPGEHDHGKPFPPGGGPVPGYPCA
jgi:hypothetical protein